MAVIEGRVTIVQESRFQLTDDRGASHLFLLGYHAAAEPAQLDALQRRQARIRVAYRRPTGLLGLVADSIEILPAEAA